MSDVGWVRNLGGLLSHLGSTRTPDGREPDTDTRREAEAWPIVHARALPRFLSVLAARPAPVLLDCGPVVGANVTFFGEHLNCKVHIEDLFADVDRHAREARQDQLGSFLASRITLGDGVVDGILAWDLFDFLDRRAALGLAASLVRVLKNEGVLLAFFGAAGAGTLGFAKYVVDDDSHVKQIAYPSSAVRGPAPLNRDIIRMFEGLTVSDSVLLKNGLREILFRKTAGRHVI